MQEDMKLIRRKIREAKKLPSSNRAEYEIKDRILRHWKGEEYKMKRAIELDIAYIDRIQSKMKPW